jgi:RND family efflux transporter MFP subunit
MKVQFFRSALGCALMSGALITVLNSAPLAAAPEPSSVPEAERKPAKSVDVPIYTVKRGTLKRKVQLDAIFEAVEMNPVRIQTKTVPEFTVIEAVPHGARVKKGEPLVKLELDKVREQMEDLEQDRPAALLALDLAEAELTNLSLTTPLKADAARRTQRTAVEDLAYFENVGRAARERGVVFNIKSSEQRLDGAREELDQLKKMYAADDLTEETEEIILKRQKFNVESAEYFLEMAKQSGDLALKTALPREYETLRVAKRDQDLAATYADQTLERQLTKRRLEVEKLKRDQRKAEKRLAELKKDLEEMIVTSPADGLIYYGACEDGKWTTGAAFTKRLIPGGKVSAREIIMTVVNPERLVLRAVVPESELSRLKVGQEGKASLVADPDRKITVKLDELGTVPLPGGGFYARLALGKENGARLVPGMNSKVTFEGSRQGDVLLVPKDAVFAEAGEKYVYLAGRGLTERRSVKTGESDDRMVEIEEGLASGDRILAKKPE